MLEGKLVNLRRAEKEDLPLLWDWMNNSNFYGEYFSPMPRSRTEVEKALDSNPLEYATFIVEKKDGTKVGLTVHFTVFVAPWRKTLEIGYALLPTQRGKGYCTEATKIMVDYLFLSKDIPCIQATTDIGNAASQKVLEKVGFKKEGTLRKRWFMNGGWKDIAMFSILKEEWKEPKLIGQKERF